MLFKLLSLKIGKSIKNNVNKYSFLLIFIFTVIYILYFRSLFFLGYLDFADLGTFPMFPNAALNGYLYSWQNKGYGNSGSVLPYAVFIYVMELIFNGGSIAEKIWILSLLPVAFVSVFFIAYKKLNFSILTSIIFSIFYVFNPITAGLFYMGSLNDTMTMYISEPLLIALIINIFSSKKLSISIEWTLIFVLVYYYVFSWCPEIIMWIFPLFLLFLIVEIMRYRNNKKNVGILVSLFVITLLLSLLITGVFSVFMEILSGHGNETFAIVAGSTNIQDLLIDLSSNFYGQLSFLYAYIIIFIIIIYSIISLKIRKYFEMLNFDIFVSVILFSIVIIFIWSTFRFSIKPLNVLFVEYIPDVAAYEPFMGITLLFSLLYFDGMILIKTLSGITDKMREEKNFIRNTIKIINRKNLKIFIIIFLIVILLFGNVGYWRQNTPSIASQLVNQDLLTEKYAVPDSYVNLSLWLQFHVSNSGARYIVLPYGGLTNEAIGSLSWNTTVTIPNQLWYLIENEINWSFLDKDNAEALAYLGIKYLVINKGPYLSGDGNSTFIGPPRDVPAGFPWQLSWLPEGSWQGWYKILKSNIYLSEVYNNSQWIIFENTQFKGLIHTYEVPGNFNISSIISINENGTILYPSFTKININNFSIPSGPFGYSWSIEKLNNQTIYVGGILPSNLSYTNIWEELNLKKSTFYELNYANYGVNMNRSEIDIRFYSGPNMSGRILYTISSPPLFGEGSNKNMNWIFQTPAEFNSVALFLTYQKNNSASYYKSIYKVNYLQPLISIAPDIGNGSFLNPTKFLGKLNLNKNDHILLVFAETYNPGWKLITSNGTYDSIPFNYLSMKFNSFIINGNLSNVSIEYIPQKSYLYQLFTNWIEIGSVFILAVFVYLYNKRGRKYER